MHINRFKKFHKDCSFAVQIPVVSVGHTPLASGVYQSVDLPHWRNSDPPGDFLGGPTPIYPPKFCQGGQKKLAGYIFSIT